MAKKDLKVSKPKEAKMEDPYAIEKIPYKPRGKYVVLKLVEPKQSKILGVETKAIDKHKLVLAIGPEVKGIKVGDIVEIAHSQVLTVLQEFTKGHMYATTAADQIIGHFILD